MIGFHDVNRVALGCLPRLLSKWLPEGAMSFGTSFSAPSPRAEGRLRDMRQLHVKLDGSWRDHANGISGSTPTSLFAYIFRTSERNAIDILAKQLDPRDEFDGRVVHQSAGKPRKVKAERDVATEFLRKMDGARATPAERAELLVQLARAGAPHH